MPTAKGDKLRAAQQRDGSTRKRNQKIPGGAKDRPPPTTQRSAPGEEVMREDEPAGEDDHNFVDDEENADYVKFMVSLDPSQLKTYTKRAKDRVAVPLVSKKKSKRPDQQDHPDLETALPRAPGDGPAARESAATAEREPAPSLAPRARKDTTLDNKRRKASTPGWVSEDRGPERLPIKTRGGLLKPNERMLSKAPLVDAQKNILNKAVDGDGVSYETEESQKSGVAEEQKDAHGQTEAMSDIMSDVQDSVYDSADSSFDSEGVLRVELKDGREQGRAEAGVSQAELTVLKQRRFNQKKALIAELCESILGAPEESLMRSKGVAKGEDERSRMEQLFALVEDDDHRVCHLALLSQYEVFKDIIPGYRIRVPTASELATKVSKDVQRVRSQEAALLKTYQRYLKALEAAVQAAVGSGRAGGAPGARALASAAIRCMCGLLSAHRHFNFRSNLVRTVVAGTNHKLVDIREVCCRCLGDVFTEDKQGEVSLEVTKAVAKFIKERKFQVSDGTLRCLSALPLRIREDERARAKARVKSKNRKRRRDGSVEAGLMEADARVDDDLRAKCEADALHEVMLTYFRVLKRRPPPPTLFPAVMEGLAKFVHLVNLDTVEDLLDLLKDLLSEEDGEQVLPLEAALHCVLAAFRALQGPGRELQTDETAFVSALYRRLPELLRPGAGDDGGKHTAACVSLVCDCLDAALGKRRELSSARVAAMIKRLLSLSLQLTQSAHPVWGAGAGGLLRGAHRLLLRYPAAQQLLENEQDRPGSGPFRPDVANPEHANALSSAAWELSLLRHSSEPAVAAVAVDVAALGSQDAAAGLAALYERGREARETGAGQGTLSSAFVGVPMPEGRAIALGKTSLFESTGSEPRDSKKSRGKGDQQRKRVLPKDGVDSRSALLVRLARASTDLGSSNVETV